MEISWNRIFLIKGINQNEKKKNEERKKKKKKRKGKEQPLHFPRHGCTRGR